MEDDTHQVISIEIERDDDGYWEFSIWLGEEQIILGCRDTLDEAYQGVLKRLKEKEVKVDVIQQDAHD